MGRCGSTVTGTHACHFDGFDLASGEIEEQMLKFDLVSKVNPAEIGQHGKGPGK